jgi:hypothetical protein
MCRAKDGKEAALGKLGAQEKAAGSSVLFAIALVTSRRTCGIKHGRIYGEVRSTPWFTQNALQVVRA